MEETLLREIANEYLVPLFSGASLSPNADKKTASQLVAWHNPLSIAFKISKSDKYRLILARSQRFAQEKEVTLSETAVVKAFVAVVAEMADALEGPLRHDLLSTFQRRIVARAMATGSSENVILSAIDQLTSWGAKLYEGAPISASLGYRSTPGNFDITLEEISKHDFVSVLSNGYDTILEFNLSGKFIKHNQLSMGDKIPSYCPYRQAPIAEWTTKHDLRVALTLNRLGEILIFKNQELLFAKRSGRWHFLTHGPVIQQMGVPRDIELRRAIYETCLDASFARTGACFGVVNRSEASKWTGVVVHEDDQLSLKFSTKSKAILSATSGKKFQEIDRRLRQELAAIDGATVISHDGELLAVGAILKIPGGSAGGGRLAAARALSKLGLGIKVSQDGGIVGFRSGSTHPTFKVM